MRMWLGPIGLLRRGPARDAAGAEDAFDAAEVAAEEEAEAREADACDRLLRELAGSAALVSRGLARRVIVCNAPAAIDFDEIGLIADTFGVLIEPVVRVGGGGFDFAVRRREPAVG